MTPSGSTLETSVLERLCQSSAQADTVRGELEHLHRLALVGTLAAGVAHEINNILTPVLAYGQLAQSPNASSSIQRKALKKAVSGAEQVSAISQALLGFAARSDPDTTPITRLTEALDRAIECLGRDPRRDGITIANNLPDHLCVRIQPVALQQVLLNIILNAINVMRNKRGVIDLRAREQGGEVVIDIADTGPGIPESIRENLFEPFITADPNESEQTGSARATGTGLGLAVCRLLIEAADGRIDAESAPGKGTTFTICWPAAEPAAANDDGASRAA